MKLFLSLILCCFLTSCLSEINDDINQAVEANKIEELQAENERLKADIEAVDDEFSQVFKDLNSIERNLALIKDRENMIAIRSQDPEGKDQTQNILDDIRMIDRLLQENKKTIQRLSAMRNGNSGNSKRINELNQLISRKDRTIDSHVSNIDSLKDALASTNGELKKLIEDYQRTTIDLAAKTDQLNTAYFTSGTFNELFKRQVVTKEGGFIGLGRIRQLRQDFNKENFQTLDISKTDTIALNSKKARLITSHPSTSYQLDTKSKDNDAKLVITDPTDFWSVSKYLVVEIN